VLVEAGVHHARGLVVSTGSDAANLAITLSAHALAPGLRIVARANGAGVEPKLQRAGATRVVSPFAIGARRMSTQVLAPAVVAFLEAIRDGERVDLWVEEVHVSSGSELAGKRIGDVLPRTPGLPCPIALRHAPGERFVSNPDPDMVIAAGDTLIVMGSHEQLSRLLERGARGYSE
jgi:voltage-gated potassium channel